jgi:hypothetical protein
VRCIKLTALLKTSDSFTTETPTTAKITLGLDFGDRRHNYCVFDAGAIPSLLVGKCMSCWSGVLTRTA